MKVLRLNVPFIILYRFNSECDVYTTLFHELITALCGFLLLSFFRFSLNVTKVSLASRIEHRKLSVLYTRQGRNAHTLPCFVVVVVVVVVFTDCFYLCQVHF